MKLMIASLALLGFANGFAAHAADNTNICERFMTCGTFIEALKADDPDSVETKITIASTGPNQGTLVYTVTNKAGESGSWPLTMTFDAEGVVIMRYEGKDIYATAICDLSMCNYALVPFEDEKKVWGNAGLMRFTPTQLEFMMTVGTPTDYRSRARILIKQ